MATGGVSDLELSTDETFHFLCSMCKHKNKNTEGEHYCDDCSDYYCSAHVKVHDDVPALKNHTILNKAQLRPSSSVHFPPIPTERCRVHGHKPVDMFCRQHDSVGCATCMMDQHSDCKEQFYVPDYVRSNTTSTSPNKILEHIDAIANSVAELRKEFIKEKEDLKSSKDHLLKQIKNWRIEINARLDELENKTIQALEMRVQSLTDKIETALRELQVSSTDIQSTQNSLKSAGGNMAQMFVSIKTASEIVSLVQEQVNTTQSQFSFTEISFIPHSKLQSILNEIQALGDISLTENLKSTSTAPGLLTKKTMIQTSYTSSNSQLSTATLLPVTKIQTWQHSTGSQSKLSLLQVEGNKRILVKVKSDRKVCDIFSACTLADGTIIMADCNNSKLKHVNGTSYSVTNYCEVPDYPLELCAIADQEVAVSCGYSKLIQFVSVGKTMQKTRQISTGFPCYALAFVDGNLLVSDWSTSVYMYSVSGDIEQQFKVQSGQQIFSNITNLAVSSDHSKIFVADSGKGLIILDRNGQLVGQFNGAELKEARSVCLYKNEGVLVCGRDSKNVLLFSPDGKLLGEVLKSDTGCLSGPQNYISTSTLVFICIIYNSSP